MSLLAREVLRALGTGVMMGAVLYGTLVLGMAL